MTRNTRQPTRDPQSLYTFRILWDGQDDDVEVTLPLSVILLMVRDEQRPSQFLYYLSYLNLRNSEFLELINYIHRTEHISVYEPEIVSETDSDRESQISVPDE